MSTESLLITATIYALEVCNVGICDIPGDFLSVDMDEDMKMALRGKLVELIVKIAPQIYSYLTWYMRREGRSSM